MAIEGDIHAVLAPLVNGRCYPMVAPDKPVKPYITYQVVSKITQNVLDGNAGIANRRMQIDVWADSYKGAKIVQAAIEAAMDAATFTNISILAQDMYESETKIHRVSMDYSVWSAT